LAIHGVASGVLVRAKAGTVPTTSAMTVEAATVINLRIGKESPS
jgi:hypothetical protein